MNVQSFVFTPLCGTSIGFMEAFGLHKIFLSTIKKCEKKFPFNLGSEWQVKEAF